MNKQILRNDTSVGTMIGGSEQSENQANFIHKISIVQKEINESIYGLERLKATHFVEQLHFENLYTYAVEIIKKYQYS